MSRLSTLICSLLVTTALTVAGPGRAETKAAVIIGNSGYSQAPLANPKNDANLLARTLTELGFEVTLYHDLTSDQFGLLKEKIETTLAGADIGLLYYAGHGLQYRDQNLVLPVDTNLNSIDAIAEAGLPLSELLYAVTEGETGIKIVILDACRNPLVPDGIRDLRPGFAFEEAPRGEVLVAFSTAAGEVAYDSSGSGNSPYTSALANALEITGADIYDTFRVVRGTVRAATGGRQIPWITGSIESNFVFRPRLDVAEPAPVTDLDGPPIDEVLWSFMQSSIEARDIENFVEHFPDSRFVEDARAHLSARLAQADQVTLSRDGVNLSALDIAEAVSADPVTEHDGGGRRKPILDQSGEYVLRDSFRLWPLKMPQTASGLSSLATSCDEEAADPLDPNKLSPGVSRGILDIRRAIRACAYDLANDPENPRLIFQFARVLGFARRHEWANAYYDLAIEKGYSAAMVNRGFNARLGRGGEPDMELQAALYRQAALLGNPRARTNLGGAYLNGRGVEKNEEEGLLWLRLAASMGWPHAINALGDAYWNGRGLEQDRVEAVQLYQSAAEQGQTTAMANLGRAYVQGEGIERDTERGLALMQEAVDLGNGFAALHAGRFYMRGNEDVAADPEKAREMFVAASRRGAQAGYLELALGYERGDFGGGANIEEAFRQALFARRARVNHAEEVVEALRAGLAPSAAERIEAEVQRFLSLNGL